MDGYRQFIERIRQSEPQMPGDEEMTEHILERIRTIHQEIPDNSSAPVSAAVASPTRRIRSIAAFTAAAAAVLTLLAVLPLNVPDRTEQMTEISEVVAVKGVNNLDRYHKLEEQAEVFSRIKAIASKKYSHDNTEQ